MASRGPSGWCSVRRMICNPEHGSTWPRAGVHPDRPAILFAAALVLGVAGRSFGAVEVEPRTPPEQPSVTAVTFEQAWAQAHRRSPRFEAAAASVLRAQAAAQLARAGWLPSLRAQAIYTRLDD